MKKIILLIHVLVANIAFGKEETRAVDMVEPTPPATINTTTVKHTTSIIDKNGATTVVKSSSAPEKTTIEHSTSEDLPRPVRVDELDLEETMKTIGRAFRDLKAAKTTSDMVEPANIMATYAGQAQIIGLIGAKNTLQEQYVTEMQTLRQAIAKLQGLIVVGDLDGAKSQIKVLNQMRRDGHRAFKNY